MKEDLNNHLCVWSGACCLCEVGRPTGLTADDGEALFTGDIIHLIRVEWPGTDMEVHSPDRGLTVVVSDQFISYSDGTIVDNPEPGSAYVMGIRSVQPGDPSWRLVRVKSHKDIVPGEHWRNFGFSYHVRGSRPTA